MTIVRVIVWLLADQLLVVAPAIAANFWLGLVVNIACGVTIGLCIEEERS